MAGSASRKTGTHTIVPVILSGGSGTRLWPLSRSDRPKPFIRLSDGQSLLQKTYLRALSLSDAGEIVTITNHAFFEKSKNEFDRASPGGGIQKTFILEPSGRNSAAAIAVVAHHVKRVRGDDAILLIMPADHLIEREADFLQAVYTAVDLARERKLVTFGIVPNSPHTGYGYIEADGQRVIKFVEKPTLETAVQYIGSGRFFWNSGIFCMSVGTLIDEMNLHCPDISSIAKQSISTSSTTVFENLARYELPKSTWSTIEKISIDYALFEKSEKLAVVACDIGWSDIGTWKEYGELTAPDESGNHVRGQSVLIDTKNCIIHSGETLVAGLGIENLVIAHTPEAVLVAHRDRLQDVRRVVESTIQNRETPFRDSEAQQFSWGRITCLHEGDGLTVNKIDVEPDCCIHREGIPHYGRQWTIVSGQASQCGSPPASSRSAIVIPAGKDGRLENGGDSTLSIIELLYPCS